MALMLVRSIGKNPVRSGSVETASFWRDRRMSMKSLELLLLEDDNDEDSSSCCLIIFSRTWSIALLTFLKRLVNPCGIQIQIQVKI